MVREDVLVGILTGSSVVQVLIVRVAGAPIYGAGVLLFVQAPCV